MKGRNKMARFAALFGTLLLSAWTMANLRGETILSGVNHAIQYAQDPVNSAYEYVVKQEGSIRRFFNRAPTTDFLAIPGAAMTNGGERGLLGMAFAPDYATSGHVYVNFTDQNGHTQISRFTKSGTILPYSSRHDVIRINQPYSNHNGGTLRFGPDGYLYIGMGDGGSGYDPGNRAQNPAELLGKFLRIDPTGDDFPLDPDRNYSIPTTNPFYGADPIGARDEIWSFGWRNPYKWAFASFGPNATGALFAGDVGQVTYEEVNFEPPNTGGRNYGWVVKEGNIFTGYGTAAYGPLIDPAFYYPRSWGTVVVGGQVYRGSALPSFYRSRYFLADYAFSKIWSMPYSPNSRAAFTSRPADHTASIGPTGLISSIDLDNSGELVFCQYDGRIFKVVYSK
jgi:glucose/arabinose dehydrogenase